MSEIQELVILDASGNEVPIHQGDERRIVATATDKDDAASEPTQLKIKVTAPSGASVTYAKTPLSEEEAMVQADTGIWYAEHVFTEAGWHQVVAAGSGNMNEVEPARVYVEKVSGAPAA